MVGTKVGYGALFIIIAIALISLLSPISKAGGNLKKANQINLLITCILFLSLIIITPFTPIYKNTFAHMELLGIKIDQPQKKTSDANKRRLKKEKYTNQFVN
ncbi:O-antigen ligase family protein [Bacillus sp. N9]